MGTLVFHLSDEHERLVRDQARSLGLTVSAYLRQVTRDAPRRSLDTKHAELLRSVRALVPTLAEAFGRTQHVPADQIEKLARVLLDCFDRAL